MREYILSVISVAALGCVALGVCPEGEGQGIKKTVSLIMSLLLILSVGSPLMGLIESFNIEEAKNSLFPSAYDYEEAWLGTFMSITEEEVRLAVCDILTSEFGLEEDDFSVCCVLEEYEDSFKVKSITVRMRGKGLLKNPRGIEAHLTELLGCDCSVK